MFNKFYDIHKNNLFLIYLHNWLFRIRIFMLLRKLLLLLLFRNKLGSLSRRRDIRLVLWEFLGCSVDLINSLLLGISVCCLICFFGVIRFKMELEWLNLQLILKRNLDFRIGSNLVCSRMKEQFISPMVRSNNNMRIWDKISWTI